MEREREIVAKSTPLDAHVTPQDCGWSWREKDWHTVHMVLQAACFLPLLRSLTERGQLVGVSSAATKSWQLKLSHLA